MSALVLAPTLVALAAGTAALFVGPQWQRRALVGGAAVHLLTTIALLVTVASSGVQAVHVGGWTAPVGIAFVADPFAVVMVLLTGLLGLPVALQMSRDLAEGEFRGGAAALVLFLLAGVDAAFLTADLFHLYVAFEVLLLSSFVLLVTGDAADRREAAKGYLIPGVLSSMLLLAGVGLVYGLTGTLSMPDAAAVLAERGDEAIVRATAGVLALAFCLKAAVFPLFAWLPNAYPSAPSSTVALFSGLLSKVGVYALVRVFTLVLPGQLDWLGPILLWGAGLTMVVGVLGALAQWRMQQLLTFHVVSQVGYLVVGIGLGTRAALAATVFYLFHNSVAKCALLLGTGVVRARRGTDALKSLGGIVRTAPWLSGAFLVAALALAGIPPLSGFWAKFLVLRSAALAESWWVLAVAAGVGILTLLSMTKIWTTAFWGPTEVEHAPPESLVQLAPVLLLAGVCVALGFGAGPAIEFADRAAAVLLDPSAYLAALEEAAR